ncbi:DUF192 domain-containing protein [Roseospirillum parvum]|uniref:DUF192 domain-containing protein n=1 Tax=Roseospirillum parvum TaxID=83401 RepID=A0A1G8B7T6_9PROT|nr:DUF192 domain-containing protein [Roseospirillum parvum]SDH29063.1 hypothetical protein SAMN05421742_105254 [Roseospirillum parvum]
MRGWLVLLWLVVWTPLASPALAEGGAEGTAPVYPERAVIETADPAARHVFRVALAVTPAERARGLMHRAHLPADAGMLFDFGATGRVAMWMKNTLIGLDMLFLDAGGRVVWIKADAEPGSEAIIASPWPARAVLEVPGGTAARLSIDPGDVVRHPMFDQP